MRDLDPAPFCAVLGIVRERDELKRENTRLARELDLVRNSKSYRLVHKIGSLIKG